MNKSSHRATDQVIFINRSNKRLRDRFINILLRVRHRWSFQHGSSHLPGTNIGLGTVCMYLFFSRRIRSNEEEGEGKKSTRFGTSTTLQRLSSFTVRCAAVLRQSEYINVTRTGRVFRTECICFQSVIGELLPMDIM